MKYQRPSFSVPVASGAVSATDWATIFKPQDAASSTVTDYEGSDQDLERQAQTSWRDEDAWDLLVRHGSDVY